MTYAIVNASHIIHIGGVLKELKARWMYFVAFVWFAALLVEQFQYCFPF